MNLMQADKGLQAVLQFCKAVKTIAYLIVLAENSEYFLLLTCIYFFWLYTSGIFLFNVEIHCLANNHSNSCTAYNFYLPDRCKKPV